jgi:NAD(P)-dependent dehydrogenase (short-subunit alcohol dehydrogenase family)
LKNDFEGKITIVTGGASGLGQAISEALGESKAYLVVADINIEGAQRVAAAIQESGGKAEAAHVDVTRAEEVRRLVEETVAKHGRLDLIFNNAGVALGGEVRDLTLPDWRRIIDVNLMGVIYGTTAAYDVMVKQGFGHIVNIASLAGLIPSPYMVPYCATKYGVVGLSRALRAEGTDLGIKVTVVCPGFIQTNIYNTSPLRRITKEDVYRQIPFKMIDARYAARMALRGVARNRAVVVFPGYAKVTWFLSRVSALLLGLQMLRTVRGFRATRRP